MNDREKQILPPKSWMVFEDLCHQLFKKIWRDQLAQKNGRSGQAQCGVDVFGPPDSDYTIYQGVQCKGKEGQYGAMPSIDEVKCEIAKAEKFEPNLQHWIFATTAPVDAKLQKEARNISVARKKEGKFTVMVLGWGEIESLLCDHKEVLADFYSEFGVDFNKLIKRIENIPFPQENLTSKPSTWQPVIFDQASRDLRPALMGRSLGPADAAACPKLLEVDLVIAELQRAFTARIVGVPGSGKPVCAYQVAMHFSRLGWSIVRLNDPHFNVIELQVSESQTQTLFIIDNAHLTSSTALEAVEEMTSQARFLISIHNTIEHSFLFRGAITIDSKRAVRTIADDLRNTREQTLEAVSCIDNKVGDTMMEFNIEYRIDAAEESSTLPWQFCFILSGGCQRAEQYADAARQAKADIAFAGIAIYQVASRDSQPSHEELTKLLNLAELDTLQIQKALQWLSHERLIIGLHDLRCPHQQFALVALNQILVGQEPNSREKIGKMLRYAVANENFPMAGLWLLLDEISFRGKTKWNYLLPTESLMPLIERCWKTNISEEINIACLLLSEFDSFTNNWLQDVFIGHEKIIGKWLSSPTGSSGYGLEKLLSKIKVRNSEFDISSLAEPCSVAKAVSAVTPETAYSFGRLIYGLHSYLEAPWFSSFLEHLERKKLLEFAANWPVSEPPSGFSEFCEAVMYHIDESLALDMVEGFMPTAQEMLEKYPISIFHSFYGVAWHVLRMFDPLNIYVGKLAPKQRQRKLAAKILQKVKPALLANQLSASRLRDFQEVSSLLSFMSKATPAKFCSVVALMDWERIANTIGKHWENLPHEAEVLLGIAYSHSATPSRQRLVNWIDDNAYRIKLFPPRLALIAPKTAYNHVEQGKQVRLAQHGHVEWAFGVGVIAYFATDRPELLKQLLTPFEIEMGRVLSHADPSWYREASDFIQVLAEAAPQSLERILDAVDVSGAEKGWAASLSHGKEPRKTAALLVEASLDRTDNLGLLAKHLRNRFPKSSIPKTTQL